MKYLISDIHGELKFFNKLLNKIHFSPDKDEMIIMGDILDRGRYGIECLDFIKPYLKDKSMTLLLGNHEMFAYMYLEGELDENTWIAFGGEHTLNAIKKMDAENNRQLCNFLKDLPYYVETDTEKYGRVLVTHTGIDADNLIFNDNGTINVKESIDKAMEVNRYNFMISRDIHVIPEGQKKLLDRFVFVGHVPAFYLNERVNLNKFYTCPYYYDLDCGAAHKGCTLGCYCIDTDEEIYV